MESIVPIEDEIVLPDSNKRIVLCGSMSAYADLRVLQLELAKRGVRAIIPETEDNLPSSMSVDEFETFKRKVSLAYFRKIRDLRTFGVLAVNIDKHGQSNYIGPNTFAEIAVAFAQRKKIYLFQAIPEAFVDELRAWEAVPLYQQIDRLVNEYLRACALERAQLPLPLS